MRLSRFNAEVTIAALLGLAVWGCFGLTRHVIVAIDKLGDAGAGLAQTAARLNGPHGTLTMADEDVGAAKSLIVHADLVARHEQQSLATWDTRGDALFNNLNGGVTDLRATINAATGAANAATATLAEGQRTLRAAQPVLDETAATAAAIRAMTPDIARTVKGSAELAEQTAGIASDTHKVTTHFEQKIDHPTPRHWYDYVKDGWELIWQAAMLAK